MGEESNICYHEYQHMGVPVAHDRCLTEEVREGPCFPGCLLCLVPIAQRNTLSEKQRKKGEFKLGKPHSAQRCTVRENQWDKTPQTVDDSESTLRGYNWDVLAPLQEERALPTHPEVGSLELSHLCVMSTESGDQRQ